MKNDVKLDGVKLMKLRIARGETKSDVQFGSGLSSGHLSKLESGRMPDPRISTIYNLAKYFNLSIEELLIETACNSREKK